MRSLFYKWMKFLTEKDSNGLCGLYTDCCTICSMESKNLNIYRCKTGVVKKYGNILFRHPKDFNIIDYRIVCSEEENRITSKFMYRFNGDVYNLDDIMLTSMDKGDMKINYHRTILTK